MIYNLDKYSKILEFCLKCGYSFINFSELTARKEGMILLRHDVVNDVQAAQKMAFLENKLGIKSTYFLMTRSPVYNLFSRHNRDAVTEIFSLGHSIGLHYDQGYDEIRASSTSETMKNINRDCAFLENEFKCKIDAVSFHQPNQKILTSTEFNLEDRVNTYDQTKLGAFEYFSDSNRTLDWNKLELKLKTPLPSKEKANIQLLIHPMWWVYDNVSCSDIWNVILINSINYAIPQLMETERAFGGSRKLGVFET